MSLMSALVNLCFGDPPPFRLGEPVLLCTVDGCMAERLTVRAEGTIKQRVKVPCANGPDLPGILVEKPDGSTSTELTERVRRLNDGRLVVAN